MWLFLSCFILLVSIVTSVKSDDMQSYLMMLQYVQLVSDIQSNYGSSCVFIVNSGSFENLTEALMMMQMQKEFSRKYVLSQNINFTALHNEVLYYDSKTVQPLFVIMLSSMTDVQHFAATTKLYYMHRNTWLILFMETKDKKLDELCHNPQENIFNLVITSKILVKCHNSSIVSEWYSIDNEKITVVNYGRWYYSNGLQRSAHDSFYKRRSNFKGMRLKVSAVKDTPIIFGPNGTMNGFFGSLLKELSIKMNFTYELTSVEDSYGSWEPVSQKWTGVIGKLSERKIDIGIGEFTMSRQRLPVIDYTVPVMLTYSDIYIRRPNMSNVHWSTYIKGFDKKLWMIIMIVVISIPIILAIMWTVNKGADVPRFLIEEYLRIWGIYCQKPLSDFPTAPWLRIAYVSIFMSALVLYAVYSAYLTSYRAVFTPHIPFRTFEGFVADGTYGLSVIHKSSNYDLFKRPRSSIFSMMGKLLKGEDELPQDIFLAVKQVCSEKVVLFTNQIFIEKISRYSPCELMSLTQGRIDNIGITLVKGSPYTEIINYNLKKLRSYGITDRLKRHYFKKFIYTDSSYLPVTFWEIVPSLAILSLGFLLSLLLLFCEYIYLIVDHNFLQKGNKITY